MNRFYCLIWEGRKSARLAVWRTFLPSNEVPRTICCQPTIKTNGLVRCHSKALTLLKWPAVPKKCVFCYPTGSTRWSLVWLLRRDRTINILVTLNLPDYRRPAELHNVLHIAGIYINRITAHDQQCKSNGTPHSHIVGDQVNTSQWEFALPREIH